MREYQFYGWETADVLPLREEDQWMGTPCQLYDLLCGIWCEYTCAPRLRQYWNPMNVTVGQCSITAFMVQDLYGGEVYGIDLPEGGVHCYNVVNGRVFDLTCEQFGDRELSYEGNQIQQREVHFAKEEKYQRYLYLKAMVQKKAPSSAAKVGKNEISEMTEMTGRKLRVLFIGNSHTYFNDLPEIFAEMARKAGYDCEVTMIAHGGWFLAQHVEQPDVRFNILYGHYDYVVLQEHAHPFGPEEKLFDAVRQLTRWSREAGSTPVVYMTWAQKTEPENQDRMAKAHEQIAKETGALLAPVGLRWWEQAENDPDTDLFYTDGQHASVAGSTLAAGVIFNVIKENMEFASGGPYADQY